jgi:hypothetical protein
MYKSNRIDWAHLHVCLCVQSSRHMCQCIAARQVRPSTNSSSSANEKKKKNRHTSAVAPFSAFSFLLSFQSHAALRSKAKKTRREDTLFTVFTICTLHAPTPHFPSYFPPNHHPFPSITTVIPASAAPTRRAAPRSPPHSTAPCTHTTPGGAPSAAGPAHTPAGSGAPRSSRRR